MSQRQVEQQVRKSLASSLKKSDVFAQKVADARGGSMKYKDVEDEKTPFEDAKITSDGN
jgi:hypothetical protein